MKRVLLDENLPRKLRRELPEFVVRTVQEEGWTSFKNGELLTRAQATFDVLLTADRRLHFQQNVARFDVGVVVVLTVDLRLRTIRTAIEQSRCTFRSGSAERLRWGQIGQMGPMGRMGVFAPFVLSVLFVPLIPGAA